MLALESRPILQEDGHAAGRALLKIMYEAHTGQSMPPIVRTPRGKPYFSCGRLHFSISHTKHHVFCALSDRPIGIDAEEKSRTISPALAEKILSPSEMTQYAAASDKSAALLTFWVLKEAQAKCTGEGLRIYPNHTAFSLTDSRVLYRNDCILAVIEEETASDTEVMYAL